MKKIILLILVLFMSLAGYSQQEGFEGSTEPDAVTGVWTLGTGNWLVRDNRTNSVPNWRSNTAAYPAYNGARSAFVDRENTGPGVLSEEWLITPQFTISPNSQIRFFTRQTLIGSPDPGTLYQIRVSNAADQDNLNAFTTIVEYTEAQLSELTDDQLDWEEKIVNLAFTGARYFAFVKVFTQPGPATAGDRWLVDDFKIVERCFEPTNLSASAVSATGATLGWQGTGANYTIEYGESGFLPGTGVGTIINGVPDGGTNDSTVIPAGTLTPDTCYQFYVTANCGTPPNNSSSLRTGPFNFCTSPLGSTCAGPIVVPQPLGYFTTDDTLQYGNNITNGTAGTSCGASGNFLGGNDVVYQYTNPNAVNQVINIQMNPNGATNTGLFVYSSCANIGVSCLAGVGNNNANIREIAALTLTPGQTIFIVVSSTTATATFPYTLAIQEVNCPAPTNLATVAGTVGMTDAQLSWSNGTGSTSTSWQVAVQLATAVSVPTTGFTTTNNTTQSAAAAFGQPLTAATGYVFWVRADCGNGTYSLWSGPFSFATKICEAVDQCNYTFVTQDTFGDGWNGATMQVRQNGIVVATITGPTDPDNMNPITFTVPMCHNIPFDLFWNNGGGFPGEVRVSIRNSFNQTLYAMTVASPGLVGTSLYSGTVDCVNPLCLPPSGVTVPTATITTNGATINWTSSGVPTTSWDLYVVQQGTAAPDQNSTPTHTAPGPTASLNIASGLLADTCYDVYVRSVCSVNSPSAWTLTPVTFCTLPTCPKPTGITMSAITMDSATINWTAVGPATGYQVAILPSPSTLPIAESEWSPVQTGTTYNATAATDGLTSGTIYDVYVRSICLGGTDIGQPSAPTTFNTLICMPEDKCNYTFVTRDTFGDGWEGGTMVVRQNGIIVATIPGPANADDLNPITFTVALCHGVPFDLYWNVAGNTPGECRISVFNNFGQQLYAMTVASPGLVGTVLYEQDEVDCLAPLCLPPTNVVMNQIDIYDASFSWTPSTFNTAYDVYIVPTVQGPPNAGTTPTYAGVTVTTINTLTQLPEFHLLPSTEYTVYVRAICDANSPSDWTTGTVFTTLPTCPAPINLQVLGTTADSVELTWTEIGPATQWEVFIVPADSPAPTPGSGVIVNTNTYNSATTGPLEPGLYDFYVMAICSPTDPSLLAGPASFFILNSNPVCPEVILEVETTSPGVIDLCPGVNCVDLSASFIDFKDTSTYTVDAVAFAPPFPFIGGTELNIATDDIWGPPVTLPFDFCFFGTNSQSVQVGSNGVVTFSPQVFPGNCPWAFTQTIPAANFPIRNAIYGVYQDINPAVATAPQIHSINYQVLGTAPCRAFVVNYYQVAQFSCGVNVGLQTSQIVLYETSNIIEVYVQDRTVCTGWNSGSGVIGIQNTAGTQAHFPPGRNTGPWEAHNEGWRFTPDGASNVVFNWFQGDTDLPGNATDIQVCVSETTLMTAQAVYTGCGGQTTTKEVSVLLRINEVDIQPIADVAQCECYVLPTLPAGQHYYTATGGPEGTGTEIEPGTQICDPTTTIYVYASSNTTPPCTDEEFFQVSINGIQAPQLDDVTVCESYQLPPLDPQFFYFELPGGNGTNYQPGDLISVEGPVYIIGVNGDCISETSFMVNIGEIDAVELDDVTDCNGYELPPLPINQNYYGEENGQGPVIPATTVINTPGVTTIYIYAQDGSCIDQSSFTVTIDDQLIPTFDQIDPICVNATPPVLPATSNNVPTQISGTWDPAVIDTTVPGTFTFTFTPDGTIPCAVPTTMDIVITPLAAPTFEPIPPVCLNAPLVLPTQSNDPTPITGTWLPAPDTSTPGTTTYTFTPDAGQPCALATTINVTVVPQITPVFTQIANICQNDTAPLLPTTSNVPELVPGTWSPETIDTTTAGTFTFTFTPDPILAPCAVAVTMDITIDPTITPTLDPIADVCVGGTVTLPSVSNGLTGTWSPATVDTSVAGTFTYCFTPDAGQGCTVQACLNINVIAPQTPVFNNLPSTICIGQTGLPTLPSTSDNPTPIAGTWAPPTIDNTLSQSYTFTPSAGECATSVTINITVAPSVTPTFTQVAPICAGDPAPVLPTQSGAITGTWTPFPVSNQVTQTYTFTPDAGQCAAQTTMTITVNPIVTPDFDPIATSICYGSVAPNLLTTDLNGVEGTWSPAQVSNTADGTYTFTPNASTPCAQTYTVQVVVTEQPEFGFTQGCNGNDYVVTAVPLNFDGEEATYTWTNSDGSPLAGAEGIDAVITATGTYYLSVSLGGCSASQQVDVTTVSCVIQKGISPGDGSKNDFFDLAGLNVRRLEIFNRYGTKVYSQANYSREWYGQSDKGDELPDGTYWYVIERDSETKTGWIYINRVK